MTDNYEGNGEFSNFGDGASDFKRKNQNSSLEESEEMQNTLSDKANEYIRELLGEKLPLDHKYPHADKLIDQEIQKVQQSGKVPVRDNKYVDIYREKQIRVTVKVLVPVKEHPKFNFVGKLLGPKGNSMKRLQEETMCKMAVLGRGSMKDRKKEEELRIALDPKYAHLNEDLHVEISALAPPAEAHARIAYALAEVRKYLIPDSNDVIRQEQMREMLAEGGVPPESQEPEVTRGAPPNKRVATLPPGRQTYTYRPPAPGPAGARSPTSASTRTVMPAKQKILSILDRARAAMEESYGQYDETVVHEPPPYETYTYAAAPPLVSSKTRYEVAEYEPTEYRRDYYRESPSFTVKPSSISASSRSAWKTASGSYVESNHHVESSASKVLHTSSREARYRSSPYPRPTK